MACNRGDLSCKPFAPMFEGGTPFASNINIYGPANSQCGRLAREGKAACSGYFDSQCAHFQNLMHGLKQPNPCGCYDGKEDVCPYQGPNMPRRPDCFGQTNGNMGKLSSPVWGQANICRRDSLAGQSSLPSFNGAAAFLPDHVQGQMGGGMQQQRGGAFTATPSSLDVDINDPVYNRCETIVHQKPNWLDGPVYGNLADSCGLRTNYRPSKQPGLDVSLVRGPGPQTGPKMETSLCGDRQRCGNGACAPSESPFLTSSLTGSRTGCKTINYPKSCYWDDRALTSPWVYGQGTNDIPTYYYDLSAETVGARPQFRAGTVNSVPPMMVINQTNLLGKQFGCRQPCWQSNCM